MIAASLAHCGSDRVSLVRSRPVLTALLAALLLLQWGTAFAGCLRPAAVAASLSIEICTPDGLRHVTLPGEPGEADRHAAGGMPCPACLGPAAVALPAPPVSIAPPIRLVQSADPPPPAPAPAPMPFPSPSCRPRAPPTS